MSVYFARVKGYVKIGYSTDPVARLASILMRATSKPADLTSADSVDPLGWIPGDRKTERAMHMRFGHLHAMGEWFWDDDSYDEFLRSHEYAVLPHELPAMAMLLMAEYPNATRAQVLAAYDAQRAKDLDDPQSDTSLALKIYGGRDAAEQYVTEMKAHSDARRAADRAHWRSLRIPTCPPSGRRESTSPFGVSKAAS